MYLLVKDKVSCSYNLYCHFSTRWQVLDPTARAVLQTEGTDLCQIQDGLCLQLQSSGGAAQGGTRHRAQDVRRGVPKVSGTLLCIITWLLLNKTFIWGLLSSIGCWSQLLRRKPPSLSSTSSITALETSLAHVSFAFQCLFSPEQLYHN